MNSQQWFKADTYPLPGTQFTPFYLNSSRGANTLHGDGQLQREIPMTTKPYDQYEYDPGNPTPGPYGVIMSKGQAKYNQVIGSRKDILVYQTEALQ